MLTGKERRIRRLLSDDGRAVLVAVDHSVTTGTRLGLADMGAVLHSVVAGGADGVVAHRGTAVRAMPPSRTTGLIVHVSGNTALSAEPERKTLVCEPAAALEVGADAISVHVTLGIGHSEDRAALRDLGSVARFCDVHGLPLLVMTYVRCEPDGQGPAIVHAARVACELGADIVKASHPGAEYLPALATDIDVPVVIAGGASEAESWQDFLEASKNIVGAGLAGLCVGRRVFGSSDPARAVRELTAVVHGSVMEMEEVR